MQKSLKRGYRYQVSEPARGIESGAVTVGLIWLVLDTHASNDPDRVYPVVATETSRAKARAIAYKFNQREWLISLEQKERDQKHSVPGS